MVHSTKTDAMPQDSKNVVGATPEKYVCPNNLIYQIEIKKTKKVRKSRLVVSYQISLMNIFFLHSSQTYIISFTPILIIAALELDA